MFETLDSAEFRKNRPIVTVTYWACGLFCAALAVWALV
jgi:hypothetical protein